MKMNGSERRSKQQEVRFINLLNVARNSNDMEKSDKKRAMM